MANHDTAIYNSSTQKLGIPQGADGYNFSKAAHFQDAITVDSTVDGRDIDADGTKLDLLTVTGAADLDALLIQVAALQTKQDFLTVTQAVDLDTLEATVAYLTVTGAVDLDALNARVNALDAAVVLKGSWDASSGVFPTSTVAGESWIVSVAGTVAAVDFQVNDRIIALVDGANPGIYPNNWVKADYSDVVSSVAGKTGAVTLVEADITDLQSYLLETDIDSRAKLNLIVGESLLTEETIDTLAELQAIVTDANLLADDGSVATVYQDFTPGAAPAYLEGRVFYDSTAKTLSYFTDEADVTMNVGEENWIRIRNDTGGTILNGEAVYISGASGGIPQISKLIANGDRCIGVATHDIETGTIGRVTTHGVLNGVDMSSFSIGDKLWLSPSVAGALQNTQPAWPDISIEIGVVLDNAVSGKLLVDIEHHGNGNVLNKSYNFSSRTASSGTYYLGGFYEISTTDANLTQASPTVVMGTANSPYAAHAFMVFGAGSTDGVNITITVSGTSITDAGVRTPTDSEVLYTGPVAGLTLNDMKESVKKWIGQVTYTLTSDGTTFTCDFNYGLAKYEDFHNFDFTLRAFEFVGLADAADAGFDMEIIHHSNSGWTYAATGFTVKSPIHQFTTEHGAESDVKAGEHFAWKESNVTAFIDGSALEGLIIRVTTTVNNSISYLNGHLTVTTE